MRQCRSCGKDLARFNKKCDRCGAVVPDDSSPLTPWIIAFVVCFFVCGLICFAYFRQLTALPGWVSALLSIPAVLIFLAAMWKIACWSDGGRDRP